MIEAKIIADSISEVGKRITTFELEFPRYILSEFNTHRMLSRNASSSRAIPFKTMLKLVWSNPSGPVFWGKNKTGMSATEELTGFRRYLAEKMWYGTGKVVCGLAWLMNKTGVHKQHINRMLEPWSHIKVVTTATEWDNFFHLRCHKDAQPEIRELAWKMKEAMDESEPKLLKVGEWHLPYMEGFEIIEGVPFAENQVTLEEAKIISVSLCAQVSYRKQDYSFKKAEKIHDMLINGDIVHASPFEHLATPTKSKVSKSGNFVGWIQYRQYIPNNYFTKEAKKIKDNIGARINSKIVANP